MRLHSQCFVLLIVIVCGVVLPAPGKGQIVPLPNAKDAYMLGMAAQNDGNTPVAIRFLSRAVMLEPEYIQALSALVDLAYEARRDLRWDQIQSRNAAISALISIRVLYEARVAAFPKNAIYQYAMGLLDESPAQETAERHYRKAVELDPGFVKAHQALASTLDYRGDLAGAREYRRKASELLPNDPEVVAAYALSVGKFDSAPYRKLVEDFQARFPKHPAGFDLLSKMAVYEENLTTRIATLERIKTLYPPHEFEGTEWYMRFLFDAYNRTDPVKALSLAQEMSLILPEGNARRDWLEFVRYGQSIVVAQSLRESKSYAEIGKLLGALQPPFPVAPDPQILFQAQAAERSGNTNRAYKILVEAMARQPSDSLQPDLIRYGAKSKKTPAQIEAEIWKLRLEKSPVLKNFELAAYAGGKKVKLSEYRGRVVLLNLWYPGSAPCRDQIPHLQEMLEQYGSRGLTIITINLRPSENAIAAVMMSHYGFVSLKAPDDQWAGYTYNINSAPTNILIDREGRAIFWPEFWGFDPRHAFEQEVEAMLEREAKK